MAPKFNDKYTVENVFTPSNQARLTFIERVDINDKLVDALRTPGKQIVVYGPTGSGKSTLVNNKLRQLYENHVTSRCFTGLSFEQLLLDGFSQLGRFYETKETHQRKVEISPSLGTEYLGIKTQIGFKLSQEAQTEQRRLLPPQLTPQTLARFLGEANCCWLLEDFHKIDPTEKVKLAQVMKLFMDTSVDYGDLKIIAIGAVDTARQVVEYDPEMRNRVSELYVPLMTSDELRRIVHMGERLLNFRIAPKVKSGIVKYSNGLASVCHQLCLNICFAAGINETLPELMEINDYILEKALQRYLDNASDTLKDAFDKGFRRFRKSRFDNCRLILQALVRCGQDGATAPDIFNRIKKATPDYPRGNLLLYLKKLQTVERGALIRFDPVTGKYSFSDPIYFAFALTTFEREKDFYLDIDFDKENLIKSIKAIVNPSESVAIGFGSKERASPAPKELDPEYDQQLYIDKE